MVKQRKKDINAIADFFDYHCKFHSIAISLLASKALLASDHNCYFWEGLHSVTLAARYIFLDDTFERNCNNPVAMQLRSLTKDDNSLSNEDVRRKKTKRKKREVTSDKDDSDLDGD